MKWLMVSCPACKSRWFYRLLYREVGKCINVLHCDMLRSFDITWILFGSFNCLWAIWFPTTIVSLHALHVYYHCKEIVKRVYYIFRLSTYAEMICSYCLTFRSSTLLRWNIVLRNKCWFCLKGRVPAAYWILFETFSLPLKHFVSAVRIV